MLPPAAGGPWAGKAALESRGWKQHLPKHTGTLWAPLQAASRRLQPSVPALPRRHGLPQHCLGSRSWLLGRGTPLCSLLVQLPGLPLGYRACLPLP